MISRIETTADHPAPKRHAFGAHKTFVGLFGGPLAWYAQLCTGYTLTSWSCVSTAYRSHAPMSGLPWAWSAMVAATLAGVALSLTSLVISWRAYSHTHDEASGDSRHLMEVGEGRTRFLALWGMILGAGFALITSLTAVIFVMLPRCVG